MRSYAFLSSLILIFAIYTSVFGNGPPEQWVAIYNGPGNGDDITDALAVDSLGNVYVTGGSAGSGTDYEDYDFATIKYDANGNQLWVARYNGPEDDYDSAYAIAVDNSGNVYVTGDSEVSEDNGDYATIKYSSDGNQLWAARYNGPGNGDDAAYALALDTSGNIYVTGYSDDSNGYADFATIKYGPDSNQLWVARYDNNSDYAEALAVDDSGNVYVTGSSYTAATAFDYATVKYDSNGNQLWAALYDGPGNDDDSAYALAVDNYGNVYVTGESDGDSTNYDYATVKYGPDGNQLWVERYNGPGDSSDRAYDIAVDSLGNVYVTGESIGGGTGLDYATVKYSPDGNQLWEARYNRSEFSLDFASELAVDSSGNVYVTGFSINMTDAGYATVKYDPNGNQLWAALYNYWGYIGGNGLAVDSLGNVYVAGNSYDSDTGHNYATIKYTQKGYCMEPIVGDLNNDCKADFVDYAILAEDWLIGYDWDDLATLTDNWLECNYALEEDCW